MHVTTFLSILTSNAEGVTLFTRDGSLAYSKCHFLKSGGINEKIGVVRGQNVFSP
jgi:hypothetical protein